jgi:type I restriction enzyme S subunit
MAGEWTLTTLGEIAQLHEEQVTPASTPDAVFHHFSIPAFDAGRTPVVEIGSAIGSNKFVVPRDAVLVSKLNPRIPRVWEPDVPTGARAVASTEFLVLRPSNLVDRRFLRFLCLGPTIRAEMEARVTGTSGSHQRVRPEDALAIPVEIPVDLSEQRAIGHILGTLDDKIEVNRRMSETLEAMARALFKSWFVDFDPVRAKAEGRDPGLPQPLADLFPDSFKDSELGEIPRGWRAGRFGDVVEQLRDQENPLLFPDVLCRHFSLPAFDDGQNPKAEYGETIKSLKSRVPPGAVLLSKLNPEIERVWLVDVGPSERAVCSTEFLVLRARPPFTRSFVYCLARSPLFRQQIEGLVTGTSKSHQRAQVESILGIGTIVPPLHIVAAFDRAAENLLARTLDCRRESRTLAALRDTLLPKLISGKLRVKDAERFIGGAV